MEKKFPDCPACDNPIDQIAYKDNTYRVIECGSCGLCFLNPVPKREEEENFSDTLYRDSHFSLEIERQKQRSVTVAEETLKVFGEGENKEKKVLDIGCGFGFFLKTMQESGWDVYGCEQNKQAREKVAESGIEVVEEIEGSNIDRKDYYDLITMWNVLEHVDNPLSLLEQCQGLLKKGGNIIIRVPDFPREKKRWKRKKQGSFMQVPLHLWGFSKSSLSQMLLKAGFESPKPLFSPLGQKAFDITKKYPFGIGKLIVMGIRIVARVLWLLSGKKYCLIPSIMMSATKR